MKNSKGTPFGKRYEVLEEIGRGGMGRVYKVFDTIRAEELALKELSRQHTDSPAAMLGFKNEFRIMSEFRHPNTVRVFEFGMNEENIPLITMEFISGKNLSDLSNLSVEQITDILIQICQVLAYIHSRLYVHRDLKPDNIKHLDDGSVKLLDYGLMSQLGVQASGKISGTYYYLAPEVIVGGIIDESTDLYSLGIMGYELLTGQRPFTGTRKEILQGHLKQIPADPASIRSDIPPSVNAIIMKLMEKDKDRRYRKSSEVLEDLQYLTGKTKFVETTALRQGYLYSSKLVGRTDEITHFDRNIRKLKQGESTSLFIGSPAGMGKTRLLNEMKILAELEGVRTLYIDNQTAGDRIYGWVNGLLRQIIPLSEEQDIRHYGESLARISDSLIPELGTSEPEDSFQTPISGFEEIAASVAGWLASVTQNDPLVLFLDDLHWTDLMSIQVLNEVIRRKEKFRMLIVASFRNDEVEKTSPLWHTLEEELTEYLKLVPLSHGQTRTLIENLLYPSEISDEFSAYCFGNSGGNVFDLIEFLRYLITEGLMTKSGSQWAEPVNPESLSLPEKLEERLLLRVGKLTDETKDLADAASVLGDELNLESWQIVSGYEEDRFFHAIDELIRHQIIVKTDGHYQFAHDKIRTALYESLPDARRMDYHLKTAEFLETRLMGNDQHLVPAIARHFAMGQNKNKAFEYSLQAARSAEQNNAEWEAFDHYRNAARFLEENPSLSPSPSEGVPLLLEIYEKAAQFSSAAWIDASTCLRWLQKAIDFYVRNEHKEKVFGLSLSYIVTSSITGNYNAARSKIPEIVGTCDVGEGTLSYAILYGAGVCLTDWYQGYQNDCFDHAVAAIDIFEKQLDTLPDDAWPAYSWSLFWRDKARAYLGKPVDMANVDKIRQLMVEGKSDKTIYWHTLTAVTARAAFTGRWADLLSWKQLASRLSRKMGKVFWFECWISHSYLYGALHHGEFFQLENHIERVQASPDPYQVRLAWLFRGMLHLTRGDYSQAEQNLREFLRMEEENPDNSYLEGFVYLARTCIALGTTDKASAYIEKGSQLATAGPYENPLYQLQFLQLKAELAMTRADYTQADHCLTQGLALAETLDNPIQTGFIRKLRGKLYIEQKCLEDAEDQLNQARDSFLFLKNKYQAGQVVTILESLTQREEYKMLPRGAGPDAVALSQTITDQDEQAITRTEDAMMRTQTEDVYIKTKTEEEGLDQTETER
ncbi:MAG: hypothetical protein DRI57_03905 [Deltaproteobacteria bacterium]|nr:MAG: hypothetical protein DRI57_03905 [Deltaproteobacteria bacterium]